MKAIMTAILMIGFLSTAQASVQKRAKGSQPSKVEMKSDNPCPFRNAKKLTKATDKRNYAMYLNESSRKAAPAVKSSPAKSADGVNKRRS